MAANKQASIHTHMRNAVTLVWGLLRLPTITSGNVELPGEGGGGGLSKQCMQSSNG